MARKQSATEGAAAEHGPDGIATSTAGAVKPWFVLLIGWAHMADWLFDSPHRWGVSMSAQAALTSVCLWMLRGRVGSIVWPACVWGIFESSQTAVCQFLSVWWPVSDPRGACVHYTGLDIGRLEALAFALIVWGVALHINRRGPL